MQVSNRFRLVVSGAPVAWQRARRRGNQHFTDPKVTEFQERVRQAWLVAGRPRLEGALTVSAMFLIPRPKSHYRVGKYADLLRPQAPAHHTAKPDLDNLIKGAIDALSGLAYTDDAQVCCFSGVHKQWAAGDPCSTLDFWQVPIAGVRAVTSLASAA